jgi:hypothetical protein
MENLPDKATGIPMTPTDIPEGSIPSPFPYLNPDSDEWKGADEDGFDTDGGVGVLDPHRDPDDFGGDEAEEDYDDEDDIDDDPDTGFGVGIGLLSTLFARPAPFLPV